MRDKPPLTALRFVVKRDYCQSYDDTPEEYAIEIRDDDVPGGCIIWGRWEDRWCVNVSGRGMVRHLLDRFRIEILSSY